MSDFFSDRDDSYKKNYHCRKPVDGTNMSEFLVNVAVSGDDSGDEEEDQDEDDADLASFIVSDGEEVSDGEHGLLFHEIMRNRSRLRDPPEELSVRDQEIRRERRAERVRKEMILPERARRRKKKKRERSAIVVDFVHPEPKEGPSKCAKIPHIMRRPQFFDSRHTAGCTCKECSRN